MNERELFRETFSRMHASDDLLEEVLDMNEHGKKGKRFVKKHGDRHCCSSYGNRGDGGGRASVEPWHAKPSAGDDGADAAAGGEGDGLIPGTECNR